MYHDKLRLVESVRSSYRTCHGKMGAVVRAVHCARSEEARNPIIAKGSKRHENTLLRNARKSALERANSASPVRTSRNASKGADIFSAFDIVGSITRLK